MRQSFLHCISLKIPFILRHMHMYNAYCNNSLIWVFGSTLLFAKLLSPILIVTMCGWTPSDLPLHSLTTLTKLAWHNLGQLICINITIATYQPSLLLITLQNIFSKLWRQQQHQKFQYYGWAKLNQFWNMVLIWHISNRKVV